jgi:hypothetical protein
VVVTAAPGLVSVAIPDVMEVVVVPPLVKAVLQLLLSIVIELVNTVGMVKVFEDLVIVEFAVSSDSETQTTRPAFWIESEGSPRPPDIIHRLHVDDKPTHCLI